MTSQPEPKHHVQYWRRCSPGVLRGGGLAGQDSLHALAGAQKHAADLAEDNPIGRGAPVCSCAHHLLNGGPTSAKQSKQRQTRPPLPCTGDRRKRDMIFNVYC
eukprot:scaffold148105_cov41-Prasinocladus_malaysianus.AAC.1